MAKHTQTTSSKPTRKEALIAALSKRKPQTIAALAEALNIQPHSVRAAISGLRKAGYEIDTIRSPSGGSARYHLVAREAAE